MIKRLLVTLALLAVTLLGGYVYAADGGSRAECADKAKAALANIGKWIEDYTRQMNAAEPVQKAQYKEWIRELSKLQTLVQDAQNKLNDNENCSTKECVEDKCQMVAVADQQITQLIKETEDQLGSTTRFGTDSGRDVNEDTTILGDERQFQQYDEEEAVPPSYGDKSGNSDLQTEGLIGNVWNTQDPVTPTLPATPTTPEASPM